MTALRTTARPLMLDHLYGLLDGPEAAAVEAHLACARPAPPRATRPRASRGCSPRPRRARSPHVRFERPPPSREDRRPRSRGPRPPAVRGPPCPGARGARPARGRPASRVESWLPWAVAAAVLLAIPGTVIPVLGRARTAPQTARTDADATTAKLDAASTDVEQARRPDAEHGSASAAARDWPPRSRRRRHPERSGWTRGEGRWRSRSPASSTVDVLKPAAVQPGAPNEFHLVVRDRDGRRPPARSSPRSATRPTRSSSPSRSTTRSRRRHDTVRLPAERVDEAHARSPNCSSSSPAWTRRRGSGPNSRTRVRLLGPVFATLLVTDKPAYRPGETAVLPVADARPRLVPPAGRASRSSGTNCSARDGADRSRLARCRGGDRPRPRRPTGEVEPVLGPDGKPVRGVGCGAFVLPADSPDGDYTLVLREQPHPAGYPRRGPVPGRAAPSRCGPARPRRYRKQIGFSAPRRTPPGETVEAWAELKLRRTSRSPDAAVNGRRHRRRHRRSTRSQSTATVTGAERPRAASSSRCPPNSTAATCG